MSHLPRLWKYRIALRARFRPTRENFRLMDAWARAEGGTAANNPWNTTEPWPHASIYNTAGVRNYASGEDGIRATVVTLENGHYPGILGDFRAHRKTAVRIVSDREAEFRTWGTSPETIAAVLRGT